LNELNRRQGATAKKPKVIILNFLTVYGLLEIDIGIVRSSIKIKGNAIRAALYF